MTELVADVVGEIVTDVVGDLAAKEVTVVANNVTSEAGHQLVGLMKDLGVDASVVLEMHVTEQVVNHNITFDVGSNVYGIVTSVALVVSIYYVAKWAKSKSKSNAY